MSRVCLLSLAALLACAFAIEDKFATVVTRELGQPLQLFCFASMIGRTYVLWYRDDNEWLHPDRNSAYRIQGKVLLIKRLTIETLGKYTCQSHQVNNVGRQHFVVQAYRPEELFIENQWLVPRNTTTTPEALGHLFTDEPEVTAFEGDTATLRCRSDVSWLYGNPPHNITWKFGEFTIQHNMSRYTLTSDGALDIVSVSRNDTGVYVCEAALNGVGVATQEVRLAVSEVPQQETAVSAGGPPPKITWKFRELAWLEGPWEECSKRCGSGGLTSRKVTCQKIFMNGIKSIVPDKECFDLLGPKPEVFQKCNEDAPCPRWFVGQWSLCDKLCDVGKKTRQVVCYQKNNGRIEVLSDGNCAEEKPAKVQHCSVQPCYGAIWVMTEWSGCDSCTSEFRTRTFVCATEDREVLDDNFCTHLDRPLDQEECHPDVLPACEVKWYETQWSKCSVNCGDGVQTRKVFCITYYKNESGEGVQVVDDAKCTSANLTKYNDTKPCSVPKEECPAQWFAGPWSACTRTCGGGEQYRRVMCLRGDKEARDCDGMSVLDATQFCNGGPCVIHNRMPSSQTSENEEYEEVGLDSFTSDDITSIEPAVPHKEVAPSAGGSPPLTTRMFRELAWLEGPWEECSKRCGSGGVTSRKVNCQKISANGMKSIVPDKECFDLPGPKPEVFQKCNEDAPCPTWFVGQWGPCDKLCDEGKQTRLVVCFQKKNGRIELLGDGNCAEEKPEEVQPCMLEPCRGVDWVTTNWSKCDSCTSKFRTRMVVCTTEDHHVLNEWFCSHLNRPVDQEECHPDVLPACEVQWYETQWSKCSVNCGDGVQTRKVFCGTYYKNESGEGVQVVDDAKCTSANLTKYNDTKPCSVAKEECLAQWFAGPWSACSKRCGGGEQYRHVMCIRGDEEVADCDGITMVESVQLCNTGPCMTSVGNLTLPKTETARV